MADELLTNIAAKHKIGDMRPNEKPQRHAATLTLVLLLAAMTLCAVNPTATFAQKSSTETGQPNRPDEGADIRKIYIGTYGNTDRISFDFYKGWDSDSVLQKPPAFHAVYKTHHQKLVITL